MPNLSFSPCSDISTIQNLKDQYLQSLVAPMDGMWDTGIINQAPHWEIYVEGEQAGYFAANKEDTLLQFYLKPAYTKKDSALFAETISKNGLRKAIVSTNDPAYLSLCLDLQQELSVHTFLYERFTMIAPDQSNSNSLTFRLIQDSELSRTIAFQQDCIGGDHDLTGWLKGYSSNLIQRDELFVLCQDNEWIGLGECRKSDTQDGIADVGMMVSKTYRKQGWATYILMRLNAESADRGLHAICSTTVDNIGAQKAIVRAGFRSRHRILEISF